MTQDTAIFLIQAAVQPGEVWADLGAGSGTFTLALSTLLGPTGSVYAVDTRPQISAQAGAETTAPVQVLTADIRQSLELPSLDGMLLANALHYIRRQTEVLGTLTDHLRPTGKLVLIEYDRTFPNPWVPFPIPRNKGRKLLEATGFSAIREIGSTASRYGNGEIYSLLGEPGDLE